jgi:undecaprenyl-diphosphatase
MPLHQALVLAIVQSLTEFLPISSTAHLALTPWLLGWRDPGLGFDIALHLGTLAALVAYFFRDWWDMLAAAVGSRPRQGSEIAGHRRLLWLLALATLPALAAGAVFQEQAETVWRSPYVMAAMLILVAGVMYLADKLGSRKRGVVEVSLADALWIGATQAIAIVPGTSRSGITISTGLLRGLDRPAAARFSFLLSTPALAGAALKAAWDLKQQGGLPPGLELPFLAGVLTSALTGWIVIAFFLRFLRTHGLRFFVYYRVVFGIIVIALAIFFRR